MKIGLTFDTARDYNISINSEIYADFCTDQEISYISEAIYKLGYEVVLIGNMDKLNKKIKSGEFDCDLVFVADEGINSRNREAIVPALLELNKIPYVGSDAYAMALSQNKFHTKLIAKYLGIQTAECIYIPYDMCYSQDVLEEHIVNEINSLNLTFPMVVKPNCEGYSMGVFKVFDIVELLEKVLWNANTYHQEVLCEEYIGGTEVNVPIIGTGKNAYVLGVNTWKITDGNIDVFTLKQKTSDGVYCEHIEFDRKTMDILSQLSLKMHRHFNCRDFSRLDYKITKNNDIYLLEFNARPGLDKEGPFETCAKRIDKSYVNIIGEIIDSAKLNYMM